MEDPGASSVYGQIVLILVLTLINAFLAGAEMAFVSVNQAKINQLAEEGNRRAQKVVVLLKQSDALLSTIQVGITFAGFLSSASAANTFVGYLTPYLTNIPAGEMVATAIVTLVLSYISLVYGELFPKQIAIQFPEKYCLMSAGLITFLNKLFAPFVWLLTKSTDLLKALAPMDFTKKEERLTRAEMRTLIESGRNDGIIDMDEFRMMQGVLSLDSKLAKGVMVPRTDTFMIDIEDDRKENLEQLLTSQYSRIPVYKGDKDEILGVIHSKDVLREADRVGFENIRMENIMRDPYFAPETVYTDDLLLQFKRHHQHMAILKDEYGGVVGIVTLEDLIEVIVGDIEDEYDELSVNYQKINDETYIVDGSMPIDKFNELFNTGITSDDSDTIAGVMIEILTHFPDDDSQESVQIDNYRLTTTLVEGGRIREIQVHYEPIEAPADLDD